MNSRITRVLEQSKFIVTILAKDVRAMALTPESRQFREDADQFCSSNRRYTDRRIKELSKKKNGN